MTTRKTPEALATIDADRTLEEKYRELVENANSIILRLDSQGRVTFFNEFAQNFFGFSEEEIIGRNSVGTIIPMRDSSGKDLAEMMKNIIKHPGQFERNENENIKKDGSKVWIAWSNKAIFNKKGKISQILCIGNDITNEKQAKDAERKAIRALKMLSECNRAIVHGRKGESSLLNEVCRIIIETGGYLMAWVGEVKHDKYRSVVPIAQNGDDGYLKKVNIGWSKKIIEGRGPAGKAIREGQIFIGENFHKDYGLMPRRARVIKRGVASSIVLPLKSDDEVFGVLNIYATKPYAFRNKEEFQLLSQLANDISFGITVFRDRELKRRSEEQLIESYKHLGGVNRKISLLLDLERRNKKENKKEIAEYILDSAINLSQATVGVIYRLENNSSFHLLAHHGISDKQRKKAEKVYQRDSSILQDISKQKEMIRGLIANNHLGKLNFKNKLKYFVILPLGSKKSLTGILFLGFPDRKSMESQELEFLDIFSFHASSALVGTGILASS
ncbi:MAG: GAF domain-containing protein [Candidatus Moraniibacteriota bacterium]